jgi:hypothetical protein
MEMLSVVAPAGLRCPKELSRDVITDKEVVSVPNTAYYRRLIAEGSLIVKAPRASKTAKPRSSSDVLA